MITESGLASVAAALLIPAKPRIATPDPVLDVASGKDAAEEALQETASMSRKKDLEAFSGHPQITVSSCDCCYEYTA